MNFIAFKVLLCLIHLQNKIHIEKLWMKNLNVLLLFWILFAPNQNPNNNLSLKQNPNFKKNSQMKPKNQCSPPINYHQWFCKTPNPVASLVLKQFNPRPWASSCEKIWGEGKRAWALANTHTWKTTSPPKKHWRRSVMLATKRTNWCECRTVTQAHHGC
jgi:hypothetical protein